MNKIDLIIDALETGLKLTDGFISEWNQINKALAAARELRDAESKKAQWGNPKYLIEEAVLAEREACAKLCLELVQVKASGESYEDGTIDCASAIRARSEPSPAFKNYMGDNWAGIV